jgi:hypothetical protein
MRYDVGALVPNAASAPIKLFQFSRMLGIPNISPFCCKLETWLRIAGVSYEVVDTSDPRKGRAERAMSLTGTKHAYCRFFFREMSWLVTLDRRIRERRDNR